MASGEHASLARAGRPLAQLYDVALLDLDGVVYIGPNIVPGAREALSGAREMGMRLAFVTNNAARPPEVVARHLTELGVPASAAEVINSAQAAARYLAERLRPGAKVLVVGTVGLDVALTERGLTPVDRADDDVAAVAQGYSPDLTWAQLAEGAVAIGRGALWVATNLDATVPSPRGRLPGNGSMVAALRYATGAVPIVTGKPDPAMHRESVRRSAAANPIVVGDRLDTDIEGASAVGCASMLVLTGVTTPSELVAAPRRHRPTYLAADLTGLLTTHPAPTVRGQVVGCGAWAASHGPNSLLLAGQSGATERSADGLDALRALCGAAWQAGDADPGRADSMRIEAADAGAESELSRLGL